MDGSTSTHNADEDLALLPDRLLDRDQPDPAPSRETATGVFGRLKPSVGAGFGRVPVADFDDGAPWSTAGPSPVFETKLNSGRAPVVPPVTDAVDDRADDQADGQARWVEEDTLEMPTVRVPPEQSAAEGADPDAADRTGVGSEFHDRDAYVPNTVVRDAFPSDTDVRGGRFRLATIGTALAIGLVATLVVSLALHFTGLLDDDAGVETRGRPVTDVVPSAPGSAARPSAGRTLTAPVGDRRDVEFNLVNGTSTVSVRSASLGDRLYVITTPPNGNAVPEVVNTGGRVDLHLVPTGTKGPGAVEIQLNADVRWRLRLTGGAVEHLVNMAAGRLSGLDITGGATRIEVALPPPTGTVAVRMTGGASQFVVHAPDGVPARVRIGSGASSATIDAQVRSGIAPGTVFTPREWEGASARYDIDAAAGVATLRLDREGAMTG